MPEAPIRIVYDGDCPFCSVYVRLLRLRENFSVELINARDAPAEVARIAALGLSLDEGMVVEIGDRRYHGGEAMQVLASLQLHQGVKGSRQALATKVAAGSPRRNTSSSSTRACPEAAPLLPVQ